MSEEKSESHDHHEHNEIAHVLPWKTLVIVLAVLMFLTVLTTEVRNIDLGDWNLIAAMIIASVKAALVMAVFMHLRWDRPFNVLAILSSFVFAALFVSLALLDKSEYEPTIKQLEETQAQQ